MRIEEKTSEIYSLDNATITERTIDGSVFAVEVNPDDGYGLKLSESGSDSYSQGFMLIPSARADEAIPNITAIPVEDIPERPPEPIPEDVPDEEATAEDYEEALSRLGVDFNAQ